MHLCDGFPPARAGRQRETLLMAMTMTNEKSLFRKQCTHIRHAWLLFTKSPPISANILCGCCWSFSCLLEECLLNLLHEMRRKSCMFCLLIQSFVARNEVPCSKRGRVSSILLSCQPVHSCDFHVFIIDVQKQKPAGNRPHEKGFVSRVQRGASHDKHHHLPTLVCI